MIAPLRSTHRRTFALLALIVPAVLIIGVAARHPQISPVQPAGSPAELRSAADHFALSSLRDGRVVVRMRTPVPDPLLYWSSAAPGTRLDPAAQLLGPAAPSAGYRLPPGGYLILYSGGYQRIVDFVRPESQP